MDLAKYRALFLEEATEHLAEMSRALLVLEKNCDDAGAIDEVFRMAHSVKGMAASLEMDAITELAHALEDVMDTFRTAGQVDAAEGVPLLFAAMDALERMVGTVRETSGMPEPDPEIVGKLAAALWDEDGDGSSAPEGGPQKKA